MNGAGSDQGPDEGPWRPEGPPHGWSPPPPPPPLGGPPAGVVGAGLGSRVGARLLDVLIVAIPLSIVLGIMGWGVTTVDNVTGTRGQVSSALQSLLWFGYFVWFESNRGATIGKRLLSIRVVGSGGGLPTTEQAMKRNLWMLLGLIPVLGGILSLVAVIGIILTIRSGSDTQGFHDEWAGTAVLRA